MPRRLRYAEEHTGIENVQRNCGDDNHTRAELVIMASAVLGKQPTQNRGL